MRRLVRRQLDPQHRERLGRASHDCIGPEDDGPVDRNHQDDGLGSDGHDPDRQRAGGRARQIRATDDRTGALCA